MDDDFDVGNFQLLVQVFAAHVDGLEPAGSWNSKRPRLEAELGGVLEETELAEWDAHASPMREASWIPSGRECPWRFGQVMLFTTSLEELSLSSSLSFRMRVESGISIGLVTVKLPADVAGVATADLLRHVLPICQAVPAQDWFRWSSPVQMVSLKAEADARLTGQVAVAFAVDADPRELLAAAPQAARPRLRQPTVALSWFDCCTSAAGQRICECEEEREPRKPASLRVEPPSLPPPEQAPEGWISRRGPGGRRFWHHKALGPPPWEAVPAGLKNNRAFFRSIMGKVADLTDTPLHSEAL